MKPIIKLKLVDWWNEVEENYFIKFLSKKYTIIQDGKPDYILCSLFGNEHLHYDCIKILFIGENVIPDFNLYDYALGFHNISFDDRYLQYPLPLIYTENQTPLFSLIQNRKLPSSQALLSRDFCSFVVSNGNADPIRERFFDALNAQAKVTSGGRFRNNIGSPVKDKRAFISSYKFNIAFENTSSPHYCTEKIFQAFEAGTIPIYWGDPLISNFINSKSFVNLADFPNIQEAIDHILHIHSTPSLYLQMLREEVFKQENLQGIYEKRLEDFFDSIFSQTLTQAKRKTNMLHYCQQMSGGGGGNTSRIRKFRRKIKSFLKTLPKRLKFENLFSKENQ